MLNKRRYVQFDNKINEILIMVKRLIYCPRLRLCRARWDEKINEWMNKKNKCEREKGNVRENVKRVTSCKNYPY